MQGPLQYLAIMFVLVALPAGAAPEPEGEITLLAPAARCGLGQAPAAPRPSRVAAPAEEEPPARWQRALYLCLSPTPAAPQRTGGWIASGPRRAL